MLLPMDAIVKSEEKVKDKISKTRNDLFFKTRSYGKKRTKCWVKDKCWVVYRMKKETRIGGRNCCCEKPWSRGEAGTELGERQSNLCRVTPAGLFWMTPAWQPICITGYPALQKGKLFGIMDQRTQDFNTLKYKQGSEALRSQEENQRSPEEHLHTCLPVWTTLLVQKPPSYYKPIPMPSLFPFYFCS